MAKLKADVLDLVTSEPGKPLRYKTFRKGQNVTGISKEREAELIAAGALEGGDAESTSTGKPGPSKAPGKSGDGESAPSGQQTEPNDANRQPAGSTSTVAPLTADAAGDLRGAELDQALKDRDLSTSGTVAEKQERLVKAIGGGATT